MVSTKLLRQTVVHQFALFLSLLAVAFSSYAQQSVQNYQHDGKTLTIALEDTQVAISAPAVGTFSVFYTKSGIKQLPGQALGEKSVPNVTSLSEGDDNLTLTYGDASVIVEKSPFKLSFAYAGQVKLAEESGLFIQDTVRGFRFSLAEGEQLYGGGQRVLGMNRRGHRMPLYNRAHYGYTTESNQMYYGLPAVMSSSNYALIFDNSASGFLDIGKTESDVLQFEAVGGRTAYIVVMADSQQHLVEELVQATGTQPLPPRWALGNFASRFGYRNQQETLDVVKAFEQAQIPLDAVVLDLYWFGKDVQGHMGSLNWDKAAFPDPVSMLDALKSQNIKTVLITEPFILSTSSQYESAVAASALAKNHAGHPRMFDFYFGHTGIVDIFNNVGREWFWQYYQALLQQGVDGWWGDLGEPEVHPSDTIHLWDDIQVTGDEIHNIYGHQWAKMVYENTLEAAPQKRPFVLMRSGFIGSQRYGIIPWTGDVSRSWGGLKPQVELALQMSVFGLAYTHSDLGGFAGGDVFDPDLYLRWLNMGVFSPVFRPHAQEDIAPEPVFHGASVVNAARDMISLRYAMLPYNYSLAYQNSLEGTPLMRPLSFYNEGPKWFNNTSSYMWGDAFLVNPITVPDVTAQAVELPEGVWFDFNRGNRVLGNQTVTVPVTQAQIPVFVRAGAIVPMAPGLMNTADYTGSSLQVHAWVDPLQDDGEFTLYEDSGNNPNAIKNRAYATLTFTSSTDQSTVLKIKSQGNYEGMPTSRAIEWVVHGLTVKPQRVTFEDGTIHDVNLSQGQVYWQQQDKTLRIKTTITHGQLHSVSID